MSLCVGIATIAAVAMALRERRSQPDRAMEP
jgi:hypothetical protein